MSNNSMQIDRSALMFVAIILVILGAATGYFYAKASGISGTTVTTQATPTAAAAQQQAAAAPVDINVVKGIFDKNVVKFGDKNRKLLVVEVTDPSCPYCHVANGNDPELATQVGTQFTYASAGGSYQPPLPEIRKLVDSGQAAYAFVFYPGHSNGQLAAKALYCAFDQGKFWQAHDLIYSNKGYNLLNNTVHNDKANSGILADFLKGAVDATALKSCLDSGKYDTRLTDETTLSQSTLMDPQGGGTPTFILNTTRFNGAYGWTEMKPVADAALK